MMEVKTELAQELLDVKAVSRLLGCSTRHVIRQADSGRIPAGLKIGFLRKWRKKQLLEWIENGCPQACPAKGGEPS